MLLVSRNPGVGAHCRTLPPYWVQTFPSTLEEPAVARLPRPIIAGVTALGLLVGGSPAHADDAVGAPGVVADPVGVAADASVEGALDGLDLPDSAHDVTATDTSLRSTGNEVSVVVEDADGGLSVGKVRTETHGQAAALVSELDTLPGVVAAPTTTLRASDVLLDTEPLAPTQWNLPMVGVPGAWQATQGAGVSVAVIDTGVDATHPDLLGKVLPEIDLLPGVTPLPEQNGHGTRVATIIAGALDGVGMAGVAPQATILPVSALDPAGYGDSSTVAQAIISATDAGARVINLSLGGPDRDPVLDTACAYAFSKGAVIVAAGGNSYLSGNEVQYPAASPNVIAVASVDRTGTPSAFSNTGRHIDIAAPGEDILGGLPGGGYDLESGTSFATPHVAAAVALVLSAYPQLTAGQAASAVQLSAADDISGNGRDDQLGQGILRADAAVQAARALALDGPAANARMRLRGFDASPEPAFTGRRLHLRRHGPGALPGRELANQSHAHARAVRVQEGGQAQVPHRRGRRLRCRRPGGRAGDPLGQGALAGPGQAGERALVGQSYRLPEGPSLRCPIGRTPS